MRDYYEILGVSRKASAEEIKRVYRRLAIKYHPDRNPGDRAAEARFKEITEAYYILGNPEKRTHYDRYGRKGSIFDGVKDGSVDFKNIGDVFGDIFGNIFGTNRKKPRQGEDLKYHLELSFTEAALGGAKVIEVPRKKACPACQGSKAQPPSQPAPCGACQGSGQVRNRQGFINLPRTCTDCNGDGVVVSDPCRNCRGTGKVQAMERVTVTVPPAVLDGQRLRLAGEGEPGENGGKAGDLFVLVQVEEHPIFSRDDRNIVFELPISFPRAAMGARVAVPTLEGKVTMRIPAGTQSGKVFRIPGKGLPSSQGKARGDQLVKVIVETPLHLTARQRELLEEFAKMGGDDACPIQKCFNDKLGELSE